MKQHTKIFTIVLALLIALAYPAFSQDKAHEGHGQTKQEMSKDDDHGNHAKEKMDHSAHGKTDHSKMSHGGHAGMLIKESEVDGYKFAYHLIDMKEKMKNMKNMPEMKDTHHLMLYIKAPHGHAVDKGKVGYLLKNPDGTDQKKMTMVMSGGYGADINLGAKGKYTIKTKVVSGKDMLIDNFEYEVK